MAKKNAEITSFLEFLIGRLVENGFFRKLSYKKWAKILAKRPKTLKVQELFNCYCVAKELLRMNISTS